jgi:hypothetical protein
MYQYYLKDYNDKMGDGSVIFIGDDIQRRALNFKVTGLLKLSEIPFVINILASKP